MFNGKQEAFLPTRILKELSATEKGEHHSLLSFCPFLTISMTHYDMTGFHPGIVNTQFLLDASQSELEKAAEEVLTNQ